MSKLDKKRQGKVNTIISEIQGFMLEFPPQYETDKESMGEISSYDLRRIDKVIQKFKPKKDE
jgi:hypothetical protein